MDNIAFVQKVKMLCLEKDLKPSNVCAECGLGSSFLPDIKRGRVPSVDKVERLAAYLGVTTSELLGEEKEPAPCPGLTAKEAAVIDKYRSKPELQPAVDILLGLDEQPPA